MDMRQIAKSYESSPAEASERYIRLLWTGGWDSTFRILYASIVDRKRVEPHYIIDTTRPSSLRELQAIADVKAMLKALHQTAYDRIAPLQITSTAEIPDNTEITQAWTRLKQRSHLGGQYDWLARYAKANRLTALELSVHVDDKLYGFLQGHVEQNPFGGYRLKSGVTGDESIFNRFEFPILDYSKTHMRELAQAHEFLSILEKSWFCHEPRKGLPCGTCNPCAYTIEEGMGYRLPRDARFRYCIRRYTGAGGDFTKWVKRSLANVPSLRKAYRFLRYGSKK
jgi:hypothetical protein